LRLALGRSISTPDRRAHAAGDVFARWLRVLRGVRCGRPGCSRLGIRRQRSKCRQPDIRSKGIVRRRSFVLRRGDALDGKWQRAGEWQFALEQRAQRKWIAHPESESRSGTWFAGAHRDCPRRTHAHEAAHVLLNACWHPFRSVDNIYTAPQRKPNSINKLLFYIS
jgi:hypothetical protein